MATKPVPVPINTENELKRQGMLPADIASIQPLLTNNTFRQSAEMQIAVSQDAADKAAAAASYASAYTTAIRYFVSLVSSANSIGKEYPEVAAEMKQIVTLANTAMGKLGNPVLPVPAKVPAPVPVPVV